MRLKTDEIVEGLILALADYLPEASPVRLSLVRLGAPGADANPWTAYQGEKGGKGWKNSVTGEIVYQAERPGAAEGKAQAGGETQGRLRKLWAAAKALPGAVKEKAKAFAQKKYEQFSERYGPTGAKVVLGACVLLTPVPLPGTSLLPVALAEGVKKIASLFRGGAATPTQPVALSAAAVSLADLAAGVREMLAEFYAAEGGEAPTFTDEQLVAALRQAQDEGDALFEDDEDEATRLSRGGATGGTGGSVADAIAATGAGAGVVIADEIRRKVRALVSKKNFRSPS